MKRTIFLAVVLLMVFAALPVSAGNGAPNGAHYNLNIIGVSNPKTAVMDGSNGHSIFVPEYGNGQDRLTVQACRTISRSPTPTPLTIMARRSPLPLPGECYGTRNPVTGWHHDSQHLYYSLYRVDPPAGQAGREHGHVQLHKRSGPARWHICSDPDWWVELTRSKGKSTFTNVSKELLFVSADV